MHSQLMEIVLKASGVSHHDGNLLINELGPEEKCFYIRNQLINTHNEIYFIISIFLLLLCFDEFTKLLSCGLYTDHGH